MSRLVLSLGLVALASSLVPVSAQDTDATSIESGRPVPVDPDLEPGALALKPDGRGVFVVDEHHGGGASELHLVQLSWGRLVDVLALDADGKIDPKPVLRDFAIGETVQSDGERWVLADHIGTQRQRLVILRTRGAPEPTLGAGTFESLLADAAATLVPVEPKAENSAPPFSSVARNAVLVAHFDDLLRDSPDATAALADNVRVRAGLPDGFPFQARVLFDPNHGGILRGKFHSTRVLVDLTVSEFELRDSIVPLPINVLGLPAGDGADAARASLHIPTRIDPGIGQYSILTNFAGRGLPQSGGLPAGSTDLVRAFGVGGEGDASNGFLLDLQAPTLVGELPATVQAVDPDPAGELGFAFLVDWTYAEGCALRPLQGSVLLVGEHVLELVANGPLPGPGGTVMNARVRLEGREPVSAGELLGNASVLLRLRASALDQACWVRFAPSAGVLPGTDVDPSSHVLARFSEALDAGSVRPHDSLRVVRGDASAPADAHGIVAAEVLSSSDLATFVLSPLLPLAHTQGEATPYHVQVRNGPNGLRDLAGNPLALPLPAAEFTLTPGAASQDTGNVVLRFATPDELVPGSLTLRGQFFFDLDQERILPRPLAFTSVPVDPLTSPVPSIMIPFAPGVQTPLSPLGSKLHAVWRYVDLGWNVRDETKYDVDVAGLAWAPSQGNVIADFYERFEIRLAHSRFLPDESLDTNLLPKYADSGLHGPFSSNVLEDPLSPQKVVHPRDLGYAINPAKLFVGASGRTLMPYPLNQGPAPFQSYTWRDTRVRATGGPDGAGVPMDIESGAPLFLEPNHGTLAAADDVPSIGLPLLMEFRCYPSDTGLGLNSLGTLLAINSSALPAFRAYSTGGINSSGLPVVKNPDNEGDPSGGFDPSSTPPGQPTSPFDNVFYIGQLDLVTRVSRVITAWIDTGAQAPDFVALFGDPLYGSSGGALPVSFEVRGALSFTGVGSQDVPFDASNMNAYGEIDPTQAVPSFAAAGPAWSDDIDGIDGARYVQLRITLASDVESGFSPSLDGLAIAFQE